MSLCRSKSLALFTRYPPSAPAKDSITLTFGPPVYKTLPLFVALYSVLVLLFCFPRLRSAVDRTTHSTKRFIPSLVLSISIHQPHPTVHPSLMSGHALPL